MLIIVVNLQANQVNLLVRETHLAPHQKFSRFFISSKLVCDLNGRLAPFKASDDLKSSETS